MPIYQFYCAGCHALYSFRSPRVDTCTRPACPTCAQPDLERRVAPFAISKGRKESDEGGDGLGDLDEARLERAMQSLAGDLDGIDENDPRQAARVLRKLYDATGLDVGPGMDEAIRRMEAGEDPDEIEQELGDVLEQEDPFGGGGEGSSMRLDRLRRRLPPAVDERLYDLVPAAAGGARS